MDKIFKKLVEEFSEIYQKGWIKSSNAISSGVGMTFEKLLGKEEDNFSFPDYEGIEIKTQRINTIYPITLFGLAPWGKEFPEIERLRKTYGYFDYEPVEQRKLNVEFYASKNILICNRYFFNLEINREERKIYLIIKDIEHNIIEKSAFWDFDDIEDKLNNKLKYLGFVHAASKNKLGAEYFKYFKLECFILKGMDTFLDLLEKNIISISITTSPVKYGPSIGKNKSSCYFRINKFDLNRMFTLDYSKNFYNYMHY